MNHYKSIALVVCASFVLMSCDRGSSDTITATPLPPEGGSSASTTAAPTGGSSTITATPLPAGTSPLAPDFASLEQCIIGPWVLHANQVNNVFQNTQMASLPGFSSSVAGQANVEFFANGTFKYSPNFTMTISMQGQSGTGQWSGDLVGRWSVSNDVLTMSQTTNSIKGTYTMFGTRQALQLPAFFSGTARVVECKPQTFKYELNTPTGAFTQNLVR